MLMLVVGMVLGGFVGHKISSMLAAMKAKKAAAVIAPVVDSAPK